MQTKELGSPARTTHPEGARDGSTAQLPSFPMFASVAFEFGAATYVLAKGGPPNAAGVRFGRTGAVRDRLLTLILSAIRHRCRGASRRAARRLPPSTRGPLRNREMTDDLEPRRDLACAVRTFQKEVLGQDEPTGEFDEQTCSALESSYGA